FADDFAVANFIIICIYEAGDHSLAKPETSINGYYLPVAGNRIGGEQYPRRPRKHHLLNYHRQLYFTMIEAVLQAVYYRAVGKQRRPALADMLQDILLTDDVQIRVLLARKRCRRQIFRRCA